MTVSQKEAVYQSVASVVNESGESINAETATHLTTEQRKQVISILLELTESGGVSVNPESKAAQNLPKYWDGALSNWIRKDTRLNGGTEHMIKNPGSRSGDEMLKNLKLLRSTQTDEAAIAAIDEAIADRIAELKPAAQPKAVNVDALPEALRHLAS